MQPLGLAVLDGAQCILLECLRQPRQPCWPTHIPSRAIDFHIALFLPLNEIWSFFLNMVFDKFRERACGRQPSKPPLSLDIIKRHLDPAAFESYLSTIKL